MGALRHSLPGVLALLAGCGSPGSVLIVDLETEYRGRVESVDEPAEFSEVVTQLLRGGPEIEAEERYAASAADDFLAGVRVATFTGVAPGPVTIRVALVEPATGEIASAAREPDVDGPRVETVYVPRDCGGVPCPGTCEGDVDCEQHASCAVSRCVSARCRTVLDHSRCEPTERCDPAVDCVGLHRLYAGTATACRQTGNDVSCWGDNGAGQIAPGGVPAVLTPTPSRWSGVLALAGRLDEVCAVTVFGALSCSRGGAAEVGRVIDAAVGGLASPSVVFRHRCVIRGDRSVVCAGHNQLGQLGVGSVDVDPPGVTAIEHPFGTSVIGIDDAERIEAGVGHTCALRESGRVWCWGSGGRGELGSGRLESSPTPRLVAGIRDAVQLSVGALHACVVRHGGRVSCWGDDGHGQLGRPGRERSAVPVDVPDLEGAVQVAAGRFHTCARVIDAEDATLRCWGEGARGQLGDGRATSSGSPVRVLGLRQVADVVAGDDFTCAEDREGVVSCWGANDLGQLGDGTTDDRAEPAPVVGP